MIICYFCKSQSHTMEANDWTRKSSLIALKVNAALDRLKLTKQELASRLGVSPQYVSRIVKGGENLTLETVARLEKALGTVLLDDSPSRRYTRISPVRHISSFQAYENYLPGPRFKIRKAILFESSIPVEPEPSSLRILYSTRSFARIPEELLTVNASVQYQYGSSLCLDLDLTIIFREEGLQTLLRPSAGGTLECAEGFLEQRLRECCDSVRGFVAATLAGTSLEAFPLPFYTDDQLYEANEIRFIQEHA